MNPPQPHRSTHWPFRLVAASITLALGACAMEPRQPEAMPAPPPFAAGWQEHTSPLFNLGPGPTAGSTVWLVSGLLPRGRYQVISRDGDRARLIDGHRFEVDGSPNKEIRLILPFTSGRVEALDERWVVAQAPAKPPAKTP
ncbi:MAG TPA: hypothetical protein VGQ91_08925 [Ideonella sp.]|jgi:hypothetical protein|nr:hypothetical protein [Ideonella sp.]